jgi:hypothetical protein
VKPYLVDVASQHIADEDFPALPPASVLLDPIPYDQLTDGAIPADTPLRTVDQEITPRDAYCVLELADNWISESNLDSQCSDIVE